jgi:Excalibur calcium-binding domain
MRRSIIIVAAMAAFVTPVMAAGKIKAKPETLEDAGARAEVEAEGDKVEKPSKVELYFRTCKDARANGYHRMRVGEPGYARHLDRDNDGIACE